MAGGDVIGQANSSADFATKHKHQGRSWPEM